MPTINLNDRTVKALDPADRRQLYYDGAIKGFGLRLDPRRLGASGRVGGYFFQYRPFPGTRAQPVRRVKIGAIEKITATEARRQAKQYQGQVAERRDPWLEQDEAKRRGAGLTVRKAVDAFLKARASDARPRTIAEYRKALAGHLLPKYGSRLLVDLTEADLRKAVISIKAPVAKVRVFASLSVFLNWCMAEGHLRASPLAAVPKPKEPASERERVLSAGELADVWRAAERLAWPFGDIVRLLLLLGQRRQETSGMRWSEIDAAARVWNIPPARAKSRRGHRVHLAEPALAIIRGVPKLEDKDGKPVDFIFSTTLRSPVSGWSKAKSELDRLIGEAREARGAPPMAAWVLHDLRRSVATGLQELGIDPGIIDRILNHAASGAQRGMRKIYQRFEHDAERRRALERWAAHIRAAVKGDARAASKVVKLRT